MSPVVSIIIPTCNRPHLLPRAVKSVLVQTFSDWELLIVGNSPTEETTTLVQKFEEKDGRIRYLTEGRRGIGIARNRGLEEARGEFVAFLDDDDEWLPKRLEHQLAFMSSHPDIGLLYSQAYVKDGNGHPIGLKPAGKPVWNLGDLIERNSIPSLTVLMRRRCLERVNGFDPDILIVEDYDLWLRMAKEFPIAYFPEPLAIHYRHGGNFSTRPIVRYENMIRIFQKLLTLCEDPLHRMQVGRRLAFLHHILVKGHVVLGDTPEAKRHLRKMRDLIRHFHFSGCGRLLVKSFILSLLLSGGPVVSRILGRFWVKRDSIYFPTQWKLGGIKRHEAS